MPLLLGAMCSLCWHLCDSGVFGRPHRPRLFFCLLFLLLPSLQSL
eukprot:COSAG05_NODE_2422_length_3079_cov_19.994336_1_plen_44_part_10